MSISTDESCAKEHVHESVDINATLVKDPEERAMCEAWLQLVRTFGQSRTGHRQAAEVVGILNAKTRLLWGHELRTLEQDVAQGVGLDCSQATAGKSSFEREFEAKLVGFAKDEASRLQACLQHAAIVREWANELDLDTVHVARS